MNAQAQRAWKNIWRDRESIRFPRHWQNQIRREAALERQIAALQRQNEAQAQRIAELEEESNEAWPNPFLLSGDELDRAERQVRSP